MCARVQRLDPGLCFAGVACSCAADAAVDDRPVEDGCVAEAAVISLDGLVGIRTFPLVLAGHPDVCGGWVHGGWLGTIVVNN